jgi:hypothetical protein
MTMLEPNWNQPGPTIEDVKRMWTEIKISNDPLNDAAIEMLLKELRLTHDNGGAEFARFAFDPHPVLHWFGSRNRLDEINFFRGFFAFPGVVETFAPLQSGSISLKLGVGGNPFKLDGELAETLVYGGAYTRFSGNSRQAKDLASRFCDAVFGDRFEEILLFSSHEAWSDWFYGIAWDHTWIGFDKRECKVWILCVTDTD